jgi:hypothetical protein
MKFKIDFSGARKKLKKLEYIEKAMKYQSEKWASKLLKHIIRNISGRILKTRTGHLRRNIAYIIKLIGHKLKLTVGTGVGRAREVKYARILEKGGRIIPKRARMLTIPLPGVKGRARNYEDTFILKSRKGNLLVVQRTGTGIRPLFILKREVNIPAFHWLFRSISDMKPWLYRLLDPDELLKLMNRMGG